MRTLAAAILLLAACKAPPPVELAVGKPAPPIELERVLGGPVETPKGPLDFGGKPVVLEFWATWCGPCLAWAPHLDHLAAKYDGRVVFLSVTDEPEGLVRRFLKKNPLGGWVGLTPPKTLLKTYKVIKRPTTFVIDSKGVLAAITDPWMVDGEMLDAVLAGKPVTVSAGDSERKRLTLWLGGETGKVPAAEIRVSSPPAKETLPAYFSKVSRAFKDEPLLDILAAAYDVRPKFIDIPKPLAEERYDAVLHLPGVPEERALKAFQAVLAARLSLDVRRKTRSIPGYTLTSVAPKFKEAPAGEESYNAAMGPTSDSYFGHNSDISSFVWALETVTGKPVIDKTGLRKGYSFKVEWKPGGLEAAVRDQLGLALTPGVVEVDALEVRR